VLDVSSAALARARTRLGPKAALAHFIEADVIADWQTPTVDVWHDRALFHFLTVVEQRDAYVRHLRRSLKGGGTAIIATFAPDGPTKCSGLPVERYSPAGVAAVLGPEFEMAETATDSHQTPFGGTQSFSYGRFIRR
jgi:SAM-dependent methyltransferase